MTDEITVAKSVAELVVKHPETRKPLEEMGIDYCCAGKNSTYKVIVGRSKSVTGPYLDRADQPMTHGGGTLVAKGNDEWAAVGHEAVFTFNGTDYLVMHGYDNSDRGRSKLIIKPIKWQDGWPSVAF